MNAVPNPNTVPQEPKGCIRALNISLALTLTLRNQKAAFKSWVGVVEEQNQGQG